MNLEASELTFTDKVQARIEGFNKDPETVKWLGDDFNKTVQEGGSVVPQGYSLEEYTEAVATLCQEIYDEYGEDVDPRRLPDRVILRINGFIDGSFPTNEEENAKDALKSPGPQDIFGEDYFGERLAIIQVVSLDGTRSHDKYVRMPMRTENELD